MEKHEEQCAEIQYLREQLFIAEQHKCRLKLLLKETLEKSVGEGMLDLIERIKKENLIMLRRIVYKSGEDETIDAEFLRNVRVQGSNIHPIEVSIISIDQIKDHLFYGVRIFYRGDEIVQIEEP